MILFTAGTAIAQAPDATELVRRSDNIMQGQSNAGTYRMTVTTPRWERQLTLNVWSQDKEKTFIRILSPAKEAGIGSLRIGNEMWNYLPSVEKIIKIPPSMMLQPWMGSDFTNDDLVKQSSIVHDYTHTIVGQETISGNEAYKIRLDPKPDAPVIWGKILLWVRQSDAVPLKEEYYDERGRLVKVLTYSDIGPVNDREIPRTWTMTSQIKKGHQTVIVVEQVEYNTPIEPNIFTRTYLKRTP
ncbi:MAG: outer membrane lipoprotein-sorting protein [Candidatus Omnitrophota bacterium]